MMVLKSFLKTKTFQSENYRTVHLRSSPRSISIYPASVHPGEWREEQGFDSPKNYGRVPPTMYAEYSKCCNCNKLSWNIMKISEYQPTVQRVGLQQRAAKLASKCQLQCWHHMAHNVGQVVTRQKLEWRSGYQVDSRHQCHSCVQLSSLQ